MSASSVAPVLTTCPSCGLPLRHGASICPSCGTIPALERLPRRLRKWLDRSTARWCPEFDQLTLVIWGLALAPCLLAPPMLAIVLAWRAPRDDDRPRVDATWITIVAGLNIAISLVLIIRFGHEIVSALDAWREIWRTRTPASQPHLTPI